eukprot:9497141-Pyramimonas_sp.AAC.1
MVRTALPKWHAAEDGLFSPRQGNGDAPRHTNPTLGDSRNNGAHDRTRSHGRICIDLRPPEITL